MEDKNKKSKNKSINKSNNGEENKAFIVQFLALNLLILAFFILLVSMSTFEESKVKAVAESMNSLVTPLRKKKSPVVFLSNSGTLIAAEEFQDHIEEVFSTVISAHRVEIVEPGRVMRVVIPADNLFEPNSERLKVSQLALLDRLIGSLSARPPGHRFDMQFVIGFGDQNSGLGPISQTLEMTRAATFIRNMLSRGAPNDSITMGMKRGDPQTVTLWFYVNLAEQRALFHNRLQKVRNIE